MYTNGDIINGRYEVQGLCSDSGGMGRLLFVRDIKNADQGTIVLKYCLETNEEQINRFGREVRLLNEYKGNPKIAQLLDFDTQHTPPFFVMKHYEEGDLTSLTPHLKNNPEEQERIFLEMIDCINELHSRNQYHRDIKPQNFLLNHGAVVASDFGLSVEVGSATRCTKSTESWGTHGYIPPEFYSHEGFKKANEVSDIFMLGKSFYALLSGRNVNHLIEDEIPPPIFHVIEKCCAQNKEYRYQTLLDLKQRLGGVNN